MSNYKSFFYEIFQLAIAVGLASIGLKAFLLPNGFLDGGVTGISILIGELVDIEISYILPFATIPFFIMGWFTVSKHILIKSIICVVLLALIIHFENFNPVTEDKLIISIFGGLFLGAGIGLAIRNGAVLDGLEILGIWINDNFGISIGTVVLIFNVILFGITSLLLSLEVALYSILTYLVTAKTIDYVIKGFEDYVGLMIVTKQYEELQQALVNDARLGLTTYKGGNGYGTHGKNESFEIIHTVLNRIDSKRVYRLIDKIDSDAFILEFDVNNVKGGVLRKYLTRED